VRLSGETEPAVVADWRRHLEAVRCYAAGDVEGYLEHSTGEREEPLLFEVHLTRGSLEKAEESVSRAGLEGEVQPHALLYLAWTAAGRPDFAQRHIESVVDLLRGGGAAGRRVAGFLAGDEDLAPDEVVRMPCNVADKRVLMAVFGVRFPEHRELFFDLARKLNYDPAFPRMFLAKVIE
jgi:hypothetical protein